jgi:nucleotide-binding universal stress UspA family protein
MDTQRIMVALDGSARAEAGLPVAESLASPTDSVLILVRAAEAPGRSAPHPGELGPAARYLDAVAATLRDRGFENVETVSRHGPAAAVILEAARTHKADVIVVATGKRDGMGRAALEGVAETVVHGTQTPVFLVRTGDARVHEAATAS